MDDWSKEAKAALTKELRKVATTLGKTTVASIKHDAKLFKSNLKLALHGEFTELFHPLLSGLQEPNLSYDDLLREATVLVDALLLAKSILRFSVDNKKDLLDVLRVRPTLPKIRKDLFQEYLRIIRRAVEVEDVQVALDRIRTNPRTVESDPTFEAALKQQEDGLIEWMLYAQSLEKSSSQAKAIFKGAISFAGRHIKDEYMRDAWEASCSGQLEALNFCVAPGPQQGDPGDYELDQSMASGAQLSALELYLGSNLFDGLEETYVRAKEGPLTDFTAHVFLRLPRTERETFKLMICLSAKVGDEVAQAKTEVQKLRRKFGRWLSQATGLRQAADPTQAVDTDNAVETSHVAVAAAVQVFRHKNGLDRMLQVTLIPASGWFMMDNVFSKLP
ncbi:hypothetical protein F5883DRAFT_576944 [Diaporthe sp. PMI_573]|nr:hypothetical protein F5883DRAFT_576944 [Diaporthaceae sp. PMI_573]